MSLASPVGRRVLRYCLFCIGVILLAAGGVLLYVGGSRFEIRALGLFACMLGVYLMRKSGLSVSRMRRVGDEQMSADIQSQRPSAQMWLIGVGLIGLVGVAYALLYKDAVGGYQDVVPVYLFTGSILAAAGFWGYLIAKIL